MPSRSSKKANQLVSEIAVLGMITVPPFAMQVDWTLPQYLAYLRSWSASQRHLAATGHDAVALLADDFAAAWGDPARARRVAWPLAVRAGKRAD